MDPVETGRRVRAARAYAGMNLPDLGDAVGIGRSTLVEIEHGRRQPKKWELFAIARVCGVPDEWFSGALPGGVDEDEVTASLDLEIPSEDEADDEDDEPGQSGGQAP